MGLFPRRLRLVGNRVGRVYAGRQVGERGLRQQRLQRFARLQIRNEKKWPRHALRIHFIQRWARSLSQLRYQSVPEIQIR